MMNNSYEQIWGKHGLGFDPAVANALNQGIPNLQTQTSNTTDFEAIKRAIKEGRPAFEVLPADLQEEPLFEVF